MSDKVEIETHWISFAFDLKQLLYLNLFQRRSYFEIYFDVNNLHFFPNETQTVIVCKLSYLAHWIVRKQGSSNKASEKHSLFLFIQENIWS